MADNTRFGKPRLVAELDVSDGYVDNIYEYSEYLPDKDPDDDDAVVWHYEIRRWVYGSYSVKCKWKSLEQLEFDDDPGK